MSDSIAIQPIRLPTVSYGPFRLLEAVPWLMLAAAMRVLSVKGGIISLLAGICSDVSIFLAFLLAARRMIELADGNTGLSALSFARQLALARKVMIPIVAMMLVVSVVVFSAGARWLGLSMLLGFDGIAFDQLTPSGMVWSAFIAAMTLLLVLKAESTGKANLLKGLKELWQRSLCMVPAIIAVTFANMGLSFVQSLVRIVVLEFWNTSSAPQLVRALVFFFFVFVFASVRLWLTIAILTFALRESYRRESAAAFAAPAN